MQLWSGTTGNLARRVYFTTAADLARRLAKSTAENRLHCELKNLVRPILTHSAVEGWSSTRSATSRWTRRRPACCSPSTAQEEVLCQWYEKGQSVVLTSNKPFAELTEVFAGDAVMTSADLNGLLHRATVLNIRRESYRLLDRRLADSRQPLTPGQPKRERREPRDAGEKEATD